MFTYTQTTLYKVHTPKKNSSKIKQYFVSISVNFKVSLGHPPSDLKNSCINIVYKYTMIEGKR